MADDKNNETSTKAVAEIPATDIEGEPKKLPYPRAIAFIISNEFCERFSYYGMRTILVLYLTQKLDYDNDLATIVYHIFTMLVYFMCTFGAIVSDSWLGKFNTILYLSIVYAIGSTAISLGAIPPLNLPGTEMTVIGLLLIALGSGGIKPCVAAFGGDQFKLPEQVKQMGTFFSLFYFAINSGSLLSTFITPILRQDVQCFGDADCYSLAFGLPAVLMVTSIVIFVVGRFLYKMTPPAGNMVVLVSKCIGNAVSTKWKESKINKRSHWLEYAEPKYGKQLVNDTKILLNILVLYIPLPIFWALFDQQGSRWTFQATRMDGDLGFYEVKPDQMQVINPLLILVFIPIYDALFYPLLAKIGISRPLQKLTVGGILAGVAFIASGIVELQLEKTYPVQPTFGESQLRIFNTLPCDYTFSTNIPDHGSFIIKSLDAYQQRIPVQQGQSSHTYTMTPAAGSSPTFCPTESGTFVLREHQAESFYTKRGQMVRFSDDPSKSNAGTPYVRLLTNFQDQARVQIIDVSSGGGQRSERFDGNSDNTTLLLVNAAKLEVLVNGLKVTDLDLRLGAVVTLTMVRGVDGLVKTGVVYVTEANSMNMMWLLPQYIIMTLGEVMFSVTGLAFSYAQAPVSMKSVLQACWLLTVAFGNVIDVIIVGLKLFDSQASEFFLFAGLAIVDMGVFAILAYRYKPLNSVLDDESATEEEDAELKDTVKPLNGLDNQAFVKEQDHQQQPQSISRDIDK